MACDVQSMLNDATANGYFSLEDRSVMLAICGALSAAQSNISASDVMEAGKQFQKYDDRQLDEAIGAFLCTLLS